MGKRLSWFAQFLALLGIRDKPDHQVPKRWRRVFDAQHKRARQIFRDAYGYEPKTAYINVVQVKADGAIHGHYYFRDHTGIQSADHWRNRIRIAVSPRGEISAQDLADFLLHEIMHNLRYLNCMDSSHSRELTGLVPYWR